MRLNYTLAESRARALWTRNHAPTVTDAAGQPLCKPTGFADVHHPDAATFNLTGAITRAIEEQTGQGTMTNRHFVELLRRLDPCGIAWAEYRGSVLGRLSGATVPDSRAGR